MNSESPKMYTDLADWWPLLSCPADYAEEAEIFRRTLLAANPSIHSLLELGSGGGNNASHLKKHFAMTLVDQSPDMIVTSRRLNPELPHLQGDMRTLRLGRTFDAIFIHDAIMYMTSQAALLQAMQTAAAHLAPGGVALLVPDAVRETFRPTTDHGGHDAGELTEYGSYYAGRSLRYLEWTYAPDTSCEQFTVEFAYLLRQEPDQVHCIYDQHVFGIFSRQVWLSLMAQAGFEARLLPFEHSQVEPGITEMVLGVKRI
jgi:SAM-dependent methyltransferase